MFKIMDVNRATLFLVFLMIPGIQFCQEGNIGTGDVPAERMANFLDEMRFHPFPELKGELAKYAETQVYKRAAALGIDAKSAYRLANEFPVIYKNVASGLKKPDRSVSFS